jgi:photosystem II stability/assembly factor-like uncharacterized protein
MNRFQKVIQVLDAAVGGPAAPVGFHGAFWRGVSRNDFVTTKIFGLELIAIGNGAGSNLVKALKGETPFGADTGNPEASFNRMPSGMAPVSSGDIAFIQKWVDEGCPEDEFEPAATPTWRKTNAPFARRHDDLWFLGPLIGWAVNSDGNIIKTTDGGQTWVIQHSAPSVYLRCIGFANANVGWVGTLTRNRRLFRTTDGGVTWTAVASLPAEAPAAVCGLSVVSDKVVFASGTNRPNDVPRMMKTLDGGVTWTAWDMSTHASVLIDTYFSDALRGWVVGGKADEPTPTTRDKLKPVILETKNGGATWTNRLAGQEDIFPFGEWGWKIQFLNDQIGFVSLENFHDAAILKTIDGGQTWRRLKVNDAQGNANLEGVGFIDERQGWAGGWGSEDFSKGSSSETLDGGESWRDANEIGLFINRFRFFGNPAHVGYASGDTIYKYSSDPVPQTAATPRLLDLARALLPEEHLIGTTSAVPISLNVPAGTKRLTLHVWDRFGVDVGCILDEINPGGGARVFMWDCIDSRGDLISPGDYIVRLTADDVTISSILTVRATTTTGAESIRRRGARRLPQATPQRPHLNTLAELMAEPTRDLDWLRNSLQIAIQLELATLPPYLTARWTIKDDLNGPVAKSISEIRGEEMLHFGLACNLLAAIGGAPLLADETIVPKYPGPLPGGVRPGLEVALKKLSREQAAVFMDIEYPQGAPVAMAANLAALTFDSIGEFYEAVLAAFRNLNPTLSGDRQLGGPLRLFKIDSLTKVEEAIRLITLQGEGSNISPEEAPGDLAHYYRFGEIHHGKRLAKDRQGTWGYIGGDVPLPEVYDMACIPAGGYQQSDVPDIAIWDLITRFDQQYSEMLRLLEQAWTHGNQTFLRQAIFEMGSMSDTGRELIMKPRPDGRGNYGPCFRFARLPN